MVHAYSLVHDDLPALDDDSTRRGRPTLHVLHGPAHALLAGDFLLSAAFLELARTPVPPSLLSQMLDRLAEASGGGFLVGGQHMDMNPPQEPDRIWIERMVGGKTSAMIRVSLELGALCAGGSDVLERLSPAGDALGMLFQVTDDLLDATGDPGSLGKAAGKDAGRGKANLVTLAGVDEAREKARELAGEVDRMLSVIRGDWRAVRLLAACLPDRSS
jgi:farnesyl diphosphate synthase